MKFVVDNVEDVAWFMNRFYDVWDEEKKHIPQALLKLEYAGVLDEFLMSHSFVADNGETYVDMDAVYEELRHESDKVLKRYIKE